MHPSRGWDGNLGRIDVRGGEAGAGLDALEARVRALHPALARVGFERRWGGPVAFRAGRVPLLWRQAGEPEVFAAGAFAGHGVALGVCAGEWIARAIAEGAPLPDWGAPGAPAPPQKPFR